jgi:hypothetical protein
MPATLASTPGSLVTRAAITCRITVGESLIVGA